MTLVLALLSAAFAPLLLAQLEPAEPAWLETLSVEARADARAALELARAGEESRAVSQLREAARRYERDSAFRDAAQLSRAALELSPDEVSRELLLELGRQEVLGGLFVAGEATLRDVLSRGEPDVSALAYLGTALWENNSLEEASEVLSRAVTLSGGNPALLHQAGRLQAWQGRHEAAAALLEGAARGLGPQSAAQLDLALSLVELAVSEPNAESLARALGALDLAQPSSASTPKYWYARARALSALGKGEEAQRALQHFQDLELEQRRSTQEMTRRQAELGEIRQLLSSAQAQAALDRLDELPATLETQLLRVRAHEDLGDVQAAVTALDDAIRIAPQRGDLRARRARLSLSRRSAREP